jgi:epoxide hydrolase-like predicted phosphatase
MTASNGIDAILWDFGGVFTLSPFGAVGAYAATLGADPDRLVELVFGPYHADTDHPWHRLERGEVALPEAMAEITAACVAEGIAFEAARMFASMGGSAGARVEVVAAVAGYRSAGIRQIVVTNNVREYRDGWRSLVDVDALFDDVVDSSEVGVRKPDPAIYALALERAGAPAHRVAFLDDAPGNVAAARALGIRAIQVGDPVDAALDELAAIIGR